MKTEYEEKKIVIECECGCHMMKVTSEVEFFEKTDQGQPFYQSFDLAMFNYGNQRRNILGRLRIAWNYLRTGEMHKDQISMTPDEAKLLSDFIINNTVKPVTP